MLSQERSQPRPPGALARRYTREDGSSLPYMVAVALLDGDVQPTQYAPERIVADDVQRLLKRVRIRPDAAYSARFPREMPARVEVELEDGRTLSAETAAYKGFHTAPLDWDGALDKFNRLAAPFANDALRERIAVVTGDLDQRPVTELTSLLGQIARDRRPGRP